MAEQENINPQPNEPLTLEQRIDRLSFEVGTLTAEVQALRKELDNTATENHYHDEYASVDHVERSESSFNNQISNLKNDLSNLEYRINDAERKAERAQSTADNAARQARGGW